MFSQLQRYMIHKTININNNMVDHEMSDQNMFYHERADQKMFDHVWSWNASWYFSEIMGQYVYNYIIRLALINIYVNRCIYICIWYINIQTNYNHFLNNVIFTSAVCFLGSAGVEKLVELFRRVHVSKPCFWSMQLQVWRLLGRGNCKLLFRAVL